jgi:DNA-binding protein YbaB
VSNDAARHELTEVMALVTDQMANLATLQKKRAALTAVATVADGLVAVRVNAAGVVVETTVDETYFDDYGLADLGPHVTAAAQAAAREAARRSAELLQPMIQRRKDFPTLSGIVDGVPELRGLVPDLETFTASPPEIDPETDDADADDAASFPSVRRR